MLNILLFFQLVEEYPLMCRMLIHKVETAVFLADEEKPECLPDIAEMPALCVPEIISLQLGFLILFLILLSEKLFCFLKPFAVGTAS